MTPLETAQQAAKPILEYGRGFMVSPATAARGAELGLMEHGRFGFWVNGRAGVLGDVDAKVAAAAIGFMAPSAVATNWDARPDDLSGWQAALAWFDAAAGWGRETLASMDTSRVERLVALSRSVIEGADLSVGALFAGSALVPYPGDPAADATVALNVIRELRGGAHLAACTAVGLGPHATIMSTDDPIRGGANWAEAFGWQAPHPSPDAAARVQIEALTDTAMARAFAPLAETERSEFVELVTEARAQFD